MPLFHVRFPLPQDSLHHNTGQPRDHCSSRGPVPSAKAAQLLPLQGLLPSTLAQAFSPTLPPGNLLCVNLRFRACLLRNPAQQEAILRESSFKTLQLPVLRGTTGNNESLGFQKHTAGRTRSTGKEEAGARPLSKGSLRRNGERLTAVSPGHTS